ncbi:MAG: TonB-dependent receptor plug domain-containing protein [Hyphomonadaceae bacterium]|nr:TonB-dependent receptor plug domain-containing protein [Hyphomonadaceae bacterium]
MASMAAIMASQAGAQTAATASDVEVFEPSYFSRFNPATAEDMVRQLPGFAVDDGDRVRGFGGAAGNVLINGQRPSTKGGLGDVLARIPVANVLRIEIVTGSSAKLDMRGQTKVANVIVKSVEVPVSGNWQVVGRRYQDGRISGSTDVTTTLPAFDGTLTLSVEAGSPNSGRGGPGSSPRSFGRRAYYDSSLNLFEQHAGLSLNDTQSLEPAFEFQRSLDWGKLNLNGSFNATDSNGSSFTEVSSPSFAGPVSRLETNESSSETETYSLNGDLQFQLGSGMTKLIALHQRSESASDSLFGFYAGSGSFSRSVQVQSNDTSGESILRGTLSWPFGDKHTVEVAIEGAYNFLDSTRKVTSNTGADATPPGSDTIVEELRGEVQVSDVWKISPELTLEPSLKFEYSQIKQEGRLSSTTSVFAEREFTYPKPGITATWRPNGTQQLRVSLEREVAQLNFRDFVSAVEVVNDQVTGGNADLEPQKVWALGGQFEQKFWGDGVLTLLGSFEKISDVQDQVPVVPLGGSLLQAYDGPGNLGEGETWSLGVKASIPLKNLGLPDARLDVDLNSGNSEVLDPVTGVVREFSDAFGLSRNLRVSFRQDVPQYGFSYGLTFGESGGATSYRLRETSKRQRTGDDLSVFIETKEFFGLNIRAGVNDILETAFINTRAVYDAPRSSGNLALLQINESRTGPWGFIRISGKF